MKSKIEKSLKRAIEQLPHPDVQELWNLPVTKMTEHDYLTRQEQPKPLWSRFGSSAFLATTACFVMIFAGGGVLHYQNQTIRTVVDIDINPSVEINLNRKDKVVSAIGFNDDAKALLDSVDIKGEEATSAIEILMLEAKEKHYFEQKENAVLLSVSAKNEKNALVLKEELSRQVRIAVDREETPVTVVSQHFDRSNEKLQDISQKHHISPGKAALIEKLENVNPNHTAKQLNSLSIEELLGLLRASEAHSTKPVKVDTSAWLSQESSAPVEEEIEPETAATVEETQAETKPEVKAETKSETKAKPQKPPYMPKPTPETRDDDWDDTDDVDDQSDDTDDVDDQSDDTDDVDDQSDDTDDVDDRSDDTDDVDDQSDDTDDVDDQSDDTDDVDDQSDDTDDD